MGSLLDIAAAPKSVPIGAVTVDVHGVSAAGIAALMQRLPALKEAILGKGLDLDAETLMRTGPDVVVAVIAAGCGMLGSKEAEAKAESLALGHQLLLVAEILTATFPGGIKNVVDRLAAAAAEAGLSPTPSPPLSAT